MKKNTGFTLAEVLITLGIIGVVVAITIVTLVLKTHRTEFKTGYKKFISNVDQAIASVIITDYLDFGGAEVGTLESSQSIMSILNQSMHVKKTATGTDPDATKMFGDTSSNYTIFFTDGMVLSYPQSASGCTAFLKADDKKECAAIVDVNGMISPNKLSNCQWDAPNGTRSTATSDNTATGGKCIEDNTFIADQFSIRFKGQVIVPNGYAARFALYDK